MGRRRLLPDETRLLPDETRLLPDETRLPPEETRLPPEETSPPQEQPGDARAHCTPPPAGVDSEAMSRTLAASVASLGRVIAACAGLVAACGGHSQVNGTGATEQGIATVQGSIGGVSLPTAYALAIPDNSAADSGPTRAYTMLSLGIANKPLACDTPGLPNSTLIGISIKLPGPVPVGVGSYAIDNLDSTSPYDNLADLVTTDANCNETPPSGCIGGTIAITEITDTVVTGTFTLAFDTGEALHGTFTAAVCPTVPPSLHGASC